MRSFVVFSFVLLHMSALTLAASGFTTPLTKRHGIGAYLKGSSRADYSRAAFLRHRTMNGPTTTLTGANTTLGYTASVGIGNPPTYYNLAVDTGSSNTLCGTGIPYVRTSTSIPTGENVSLKYLGGNFSGIEYLDQVTLAPHFTITNQSIGDALSSVNFTGIDGVIGFGPVDLTRGSLSPDVNASIPTIMNNLVSQGLIENQVLSFYFSPPTNSSVTSASGTLTYGGIDSGMYVGELRYTPVTKTYPSSAYWGINVTSCTYGIHDIIPTSTAGVVDTGNSVISLADDFFSAYLDNIPGAKLDPATGLVEVPHDSISSMQPLYFTIAGEVFPLDVSAQLIPTEYNAAWGGVAGKYYSMVSPLGFKSGKGLDFIIGLAFLERYFSVFDADAQRVGFAETYHTFSTYPG